MICGAKLLWGESVYECDKPPSHLNWHQGSNTDGNTVIWPHFVKSLEPGSTGSSPTPLTRRICTECTLLRQCSGEPPVCLDCRRNMQIT